ncbi:hypothetical protein ACFQYP_19350 [Nonomuraea antimicrobica]|uniref:hypothetical protein n=1 Tax=Nonomuraea antimicrobica TaxID=561173 RepID=UPI0031EACA87
MTENQTPTPVPLPPPLRFLTEDENNTVLIHVRAVVGKFFPNDVVKEDSLTARPTTSTARKICGRTAHPALCPTPGQPDALTTHCAAQGPDGDPSAGP